MGTYTEFYIADYPTYSTKSYVDPVVMTIFRETDKRVYKRRFSERNQLAWGHITDHNEIETAYEYTATVGNIKDRLEVMGFSLERARRDFYEGIADEIESLQEMMDQSSKDNISKMLVIKWKEEQDLLRNTKFEEWISAFAYIIQRGIRPQLFDGESLTEEASLVRYILKPNDADLIYHFPCTDIRYFIRVFVEACPNNALVIQDITDLIEAGYYDPDDPVCEISISTLTLDYPVNEKIIILTEGSTDVYILKESLSLLYPHLSDYFSFMDFGVSNAAGGASFLVSTIKAFIGSGIRNRVIGIFDNDTAAKVSLKTLSKITIPDNIRILSYPTLELAKHYPTIGPSGTSVLDVNGLACSIELYLGTDVLTRNGQLTPIQWKGYEHGLNQYQGEVINKKELQDAFFEKVKRCKNDSALIGVSDWHAMHQLLQEIFCAFNQP